MKVIGWIAGGSDRSGGLRSLALRLCMPQIRIDGWPVEPGCVVDSGLGRILWVGDSTRRRVPGWDTKLHKMRGSDVALIKRRPRQVQFDRQLYLAETVQGAPSIAVAVVGRSDVVTCIMGIKV